MILGGAQENTLFTLQGLKRDTDWEVHLAYGPELGKEGSLIEESRGLGVILHPLQHLRRDLHPWQDYLAYKELIEYFRCEKFDLVHTHSSKAGILGRIAADKAGVPHIVHTIHGLAFDDYQSALKNWLYIRAERAAARHCHQIFSVCRTMIDQALAAGVGKEAMFRTIYSGFDLKGFLAVKPRVSRSRLVLGMIARMFEFKGHEDLMKLAPMILKKWDNVDFLIVGDGPMRTDWDRWISEHPQWKNRIEFGGRVKPHEVPAQFEKMDMLLHLSWREGLARTIPQALAAGRPVCVYDVGGAREIVKNGRTGWIVPPGDLDGVVEAISEMKRNPREAARMAEEGRERVINIFGVETMQREILETYREMIKK
jgi:glycosyltransferase involved in cell wall biosynthesis